MILPPHPFLPSTLHAGSLCDPPPPLSLQAPYVILLPTPPPSLQGPYVNFCTLGGRSLAIWNATDGSLLFDSGASVQVGGWRPGSRWGAGGGCMWAGV